MKKLPILTVGLLILFASLANCAAADSFYYSGTGHYYEAIDAKDITWDNAEIAAESSSYKGVKGHLATISSGGENDFVVSICGKEWYWLGGFQTPNSPLPTDPAAGWHWVNGEPWVYTNWASGEPNDFSNIEENKLQYWSSTAVWNDRPNDAVGGGYIVEYDTGQSIPEFPSIVLPVAAILGLVVIFGRRKNVV